MQAVFDISLCLGTEAITYPGDPSFLMKALGSLEEGDLFQVSVMAMSVHTGTHLDTPRHLLKEGKGISDYAAEEFFLPARVLDLGMIEVVERSDLEVYDLKKDEAILLKTKNSHTGLSRSGAFQARYTYISEDAAAYCAERGIALLGIDYLSVDPFESRDFPAHRHLLEGGIRILEGIALDQVSAGDYTLVCLPLLIKDAEAAPCRAVLIEQEG